MIDIEQALDLEKASVQQQLPAAREWIDRAISDAASDQIIFFRFVYS